MNRRELGRMPRFIVVNGVGTVLDVTSVFLLGSMLGAPLLFAVSCGWSISQMCGFVLNRRFVFRDGRASLGTASVRYLVLVLFNLAIGVGLVTWLVSHGWNYILTRVLTSVFLVIFNFAVAKLWVFVVREKLHAAGVSEQQLL